MSCRLWFTLFVICLVPAFPMPGSAADEDKDLLQGVWVGELLEIDGQRQSPEDAAAMRLIFKGDTLYLRGNFKDGRVEECTYAIDPQKSPKNLEFTPPGSSKPIFGIYEIQGGKLKVCL